MNGLPLAISSWDENEIKAIEKVIAKKMFTMGDEVIEFEKSFANYCGARYAVMVNSGSSANLLAIAALTFKNEKPLQKGDEVIVPSLSWPTTYFPISQYGMTLVFVDIDINTLNIDYKKIENAITSKTKAIMVPNILGNPAHLLEIQKIAKKHDLYLIEDNCESMGATINGKQAGTFGIIGTFSCFFAHHISTMEGGLIVTDNEELYHLLLCLRAHGWTRQLPEKNSLLKKSGDPFYEQFRFVVPGYNLRPLEMSGAIGREQLKKLPTLIKLRRQNAEHFVSLFKNDERFIIQSENGCSSWYAFSMIIRKEAELNRSNLLKALARNNIETRPIMSGNFLRHDVMKRLDHRIVGEHNNADQVHDFGFFIGNHPVNIEQELNCIKKIIESECLLLN